MDFLIEFTKQENVHAILGNHDLGVHSFFSFLLISLRILFGILDGVVAIGILEWVHQKHTAHIRLRNFRRKCHKNIRIFAVFALGIDVSRSFCSAGMKEGALEPQIQDLENRILPLEHEHLPPQIREKSLSNINDSDWKMTVVSAHNKRPDGEYGKTFLDSKRVCIAADVDTRQCLRAVELLSRTELVA